jgi:hypothetical protein
MVTSLAAVSNENPPVSKISSELAQSGGFCRGILRFNGPAAQHFDAASL